METLTAPHTETLTEVRIARTLANIARRAETLLTTGRLTTGRDKVEAAWGAFTMRSGHRGSTTRSSLTPG